ncbi:MAG: RNA polymerase sigma factor [Bacteroidota bacterium]
MKTDLHTQFTRIFHEQRDKIFRLCKAMVYDYSYVDDVFQEAMSNVWKSLKSFKGKSSIDTWVYRIAINTCITFNNRQKRLTAQKAEMQENFAPVVEEENEQLHQLYQAIKRLNASDRSIIGLYLEDFSYKEIAEILGISTSNVGVRLNRIKQKISVIIHQKN